MLLPSPSDRNLHHWPCALLLGSEAHRTCISLLDALGHLIGQVKLPASLALDIMHTRAAWTHLRFYPLALFLDLDGLSLPCSLLFLPLLLLSGGSCLRLLLLSDLLLAVPLLKFGHSSLIAVIVIPHYLGIRDLTSVNDRSRSRSVCNVLWAKHDVEM